MELKNKHIELYNLEDQSLIEEKTTPKNRWFYTLISFFVCCISVFLGVIVIALVIIFI